MIGQAVRLVLDRLRTHKLSQDIAYSYAGFVIMAVSGLLMNVAIATLRDASALGVFNLSYAVYIIASQFAVWGLHYSVLRHAAHHDAEPNVLKTILWTACICAGVTGFTASVVLYAAKPLFLHIFDSVETATAIGYTAFSLGVFSLNKILLAHLNGLRRMKAFSILQGIRYSVLVMAVAAICLSDLPSSAISFSFLVAELVTFILLLMYMIRTQLLGAPQFCMDWFRRHMRFGTKALAGGMCGEVNARIDVLMIGFFLSDHATGVYSFAAMLSDGVYLLLTILRNNFNPVMTGALRDADWQTIFNLRLAAIRYVTPLTAVLCLVILAVYYGFTAWVVPEKNLTEGLLPLIILLTGLTGVSFLIPFDNLMLVSGHPGYQTMQQLVAVFVNVAVCTALIPVFGIAGAAAGTTASYAANVIMLMIFAQRMTGWDLIRNIRR